MEVEKQTKSNGNCIHERFDVNHIKLQMFTQLGEYVECILKYKQRNQLCLSLMCRLRQFKGIEKEIGMEEFDSCELRSHSE